MARAGRWTSSCHRARWQIVGALSCFCVTCRRPSVLWVSCHWSAIGPSDNGDAYDADWLRAALKERGIRPCIPPRKKRKKPARYNRRLYRKRYRIENVFGRLKDWRGITTRYERYGDIFLNAIILAAIMIFWI